MGRHQGTTWLCCELLSFPSIPPPPHWSSRKRAKLGFSQAYPPWDKKCTNADWARSPFVQDWQVSWILMDGLFLLPSSALRLIQGARKLSHTPTVCALAMLAVSCPAEQGVPAPTQTLPQPPPPAMSLTQRQKLCQLKHKDETPPHCEFPQSSQQEDSHIGRWWTGWEEDRCNQKILLFFSRNLAKH